MLDKNMIASNLDFADSSHKWAKQNFNKKDIIKELMELHGY